MQQLTSGVLFSCGQELPDTQLLLHEPIQVPSFLLSMPKEIRQRFILPNTQREIEDNPISPMSNHDIRNAYGGVNEFNEKQLSNIRLFRQMIDAKNIADTIDPYAIQQFCKDYGVSEDLARDVLTIEELRRRNALIKKMEEINR